MSEPIGWFHSKAQQEEEELVTKGKIIQFFPIVIPANTAGVFPPNGGSINVSCNGLQLMNRISTDRSGGTFQTGSTTARVMVRINREDAPWIPFSFIANSGDAQTIAGSIGKIWFNVITPDAANPIIFLAVNNAGVGCVGAGNTIGSYSVPAGAQGPVFGNARADQGASPVAFSKLIPSPPGMTNAAPGGGGSSGGRVVSAIRP